MARTMHRLLLLLLLGTLLLGAPPGMGSNPAENPPQQVNGILGGSVSFPLRLSSTKKVDKLEWTFRGGSSSEILIAELRHGKLEQENTCDRFGKRLEVVDKTALRIRALGKEDSGVLEAHVLFATRELHRQTFQLSVFEPVPDPQICHHLVSKTRETCNVTLQCLASEKEGIDISWKRGNQLIDPGEGLDRYQLSAKASDLQVSWHTNSSDSTFTCLLSNPVDQKNVSFDLLSICLGEGDSHPRKMWVLIPIVLVLILAAVFGICLWKKRPSLGAVVLMEPEKRGSPELLYSEVQKRRSPPEGHENQELSGCLEAAGFDSSETSLTELVWEI